MPKIIFNQPKVYSAEMCVSNTPIEDHTEDFGLWVKREDLACPLPGPPFSKARGVFAHIKTRPEKIIGVLDTAHSQAGWAVARACQILNKMCVNYYPVYKKEVDENGSHELRYSQIQAAELGADLHSLTAGRSCILFHKAKTEVYQHSGYMMPNALKLNESVTETAKECPKAHSFDTVIIPASSGTIAAGVVQGFYNQQPHGFQKATKLPNFIIHLGYSRSHKEVADYIKKMSGVSSANLQIVDEGYQYKDKAKGSIKPPWPCNLYYDLKALQWWLIHRDSFPGKTLLWNIG